jgi:hypothetical protein
MWHVGIEIQAGPPSWSVITDCWPGEPPKPEGTFFWAAGIMDDKEHGRYIMGKPVGMASPPYIAKEKSSPCFSIDPAIKMA